MTVNILAIKWKNSIFQIPMHLVLRATWQKDVTQKAGQRSDPGGKNGTVGEESSFVSTSFDPNREEVGGMGFVLASPTGKFIFDIIWRNFIYWVMIEYICILKFEIELWYQSCHI